MRDDVETREQFAIAYGNMVLERTRELERNRRVGAAFYPGVQVAAPRFGPGPNRHARRAAAARARHEARK